MKRLLIVTVIILMIDQVLTPFSYVFSNEEEIFDMQENVTIENEAAEDIQDFSEENQNDGENSEDITSDSDSSDSELEENNQTETTDEETWEEENNIETWDDNELNDKNITWNEAEENTTWDEIEENNTSESSTIVILLAEKLWINWEEDAKYYAELAWIEKSEYKWTREQNEQIRLFLVEHEQEIIDGEFDEIIEQKKVEDEKTPDYSEYTKETRVAVLAEKLWINWEEDAKYYAELAWIEKSEYKWTREQNEQIRLFFLDNLEAILDGEYEEIIAEMKENDQEWSTWDTAEVEIWNILTGEILTGNELTWNIITWDIEFVATWCSDDYHEENGLCELNTKTVNCEQIWWVDNSTYIERWVTITWDIVWWVRSEIPACERKCLDNYHEKNGLCELNTKTVNCEQIWWVDNSTYIETWVTITWDTVWWIRKETPACERECLNNYHEENGLCEPNTKTEECVQTWWVENSVYVVTWVTITWDGTWWVRSEIPVCEWRCKEHYHQSGNACDIDKFMFTLVENPNVDIAWSTQSGEKPYDSKIELDVYTNTGYRFIWWQIINLQSSGSSMTTVDNQVVFNMPDRDVTVTPLSETIEYKIVYRNVDDAVVDNPTAYTIETETFSLNEPIKTWYVFLWWTWSNGSEPEKNVILTKWSYGNKRYTAVWQPMSWINYQVVHAVEKANATTYDVRETEILSGTTDELTKAVAKTYTWFTAKEITQKTIKWDGSTVVRIQYQRNVYTITFDTDGGSEILPITWKYGSDLTAPSDPTRTGYIFTGWKPAFPSTMPLSWSKLVAQWEQGLEVINNIEEELETARKTLNKNKIKWKETYNNVTVNVEAPKNSFPEWTELRITPITWSEQKQAIKEELIKNTNVTTESELVSFDISFIYILSGWEEIELQPYTWQTVKVSFNYKNNNKFNKSKKDKNNELKVYHFEKVKNKKDKRSEEIEVKEIKVNESESTEWEIVIDAENFSVYTIVTQLAEEPIGNMSTWIEGSNFERIVQQNPEDTTQCVIIMDRNLWATSNNISNSDSYGYYYQRWNNYGFTSSSSSTSTTRPSVSSYGAGTYNSSTFIKYYVEWGSILSRTRDYNQQWMSSMNNNLWWWWSDSSNNSYGQWQTNYTDRQWPCPDGWHVPSAYEWSTLNRYWATSKWYSTTSTNNVAWIQSANLSEYTSYFHIPSNGYLWHSYQGGFFGIGASESFEVTNGWTYAYLYTSSPYDSNAAITMYSNWGFMSFTDNYTERAEWIRCFKNPVRYLIQFVNYDGTVLQSGMVMEWGTPVYNWSVPQKPADTQYIYIFEWWDSKISMVAAAKTYTATFGSHDTSEVYTVTFNTNGWNSIPEQVVWDWGKVIKPADPTKSDQIFKYWTTDSQWNNQYNFDTPVEWDLILYAQWANKCTVTFTNGSCYRNNNRANCTFSINPTTIDVACGTPVRRPEDPNSPISVTINGTSRSVYFSRWVRDNSQPGANNSSYNYDFSEPVTWPLTLYAIWNATYYTVRFDANGWTLAWEWFTEIDSNVWQYGLVREPDEPSKTWYLLKWWSRTQNNGSPYDFSSQVTSSFTLYAQWDPIIYTIRYKANGWTWTMADTTMTYDVSNNLRMNTFTKDNASFSGWNTKFDWSWVWYSDGQSVINLADTTWDVVKLYAIWNCNTGYYDENWACVRYAQDCEFQWQTIEDGGSLTVYSTASTTCPIICTTWTVTCNNGTVSWNTGYTNLSCSPVSTTCDASFTLLSTGSNWTYSSCTPYAANGNTCTAWTTVYKLTNCTNGYHTENNATCTVNSKSVACTQSWKPSNSEYVPWNVTVTWNGTWNTGSWSTADNCDWTCNTHYHLNQAENGCDIDTFLITWIDWDWHILTTGEVDYNTTPTYSGPTPTKTATVQYSYSFNGVWSPTIVPATTWATYTAQFDSTVNQYTATINITPSWYGSVNSGSVTKNYGSTITENGNKITIWWTEITATPTTDTAEWDYEFVNWTNNCWNTLTDNCTITANFTRTKKLYLITFKNRDGTTLQTWMVEYWTTPTYNGSTPTKAATQQFTYTFAWWSPTITGVTETATYIAIYDTITNPYTAIINVSPSGYGTVSSDLVTKSYGSSITTNWNKITIWWTEVTATPTADTAEWDYEFVNWTNNCGNTLTWNCTITANFTRTKKSYLITFNNRDWTTFQTWMVEYWTTPTYNWATPTKEATQQFTYTFAWWSPTITGVTETATYTAIYNTTTNQYIATIWVSPSGYGSVSSGSVTKNYGSTITENGNKITIWWTEITATPTTASQEFTYTFSWWNNTCGGTLTGNCTITAQFKRTTNQYTITFYDEDGTTELWSSTVDYWTDATYGWTTPTKAATQQYTYEFEDWYTSPEWWSVDDLSNVTADRNVYARYSFVVNPYTATINITPSWYGSVSSESVTKGYGSSITTNWNTLTIWWTEVTATPEADTAEWDYEFVNWTNNCGNTLTWNCTITANFTRTKKSYLITFNNRDWTTFQTWMVEYWTTPTYNWATPTKEATQQFTYTFAWWSPTITGVTETATYTAIYSSTVNQYNVTVSASPEWWWTLSNDISGRYDFGAWVFINTSLLGHLQLGSCTSHAWWTNSINDPAISTLSINAIPGWWSAGWVCNYTDAIPATATVQYTYTFSWWNNTCGDAVTHDCTITAEFTRTVNNYNVTFNSNWWTPIPDTQSIAYGSKATRPADPTRTGYTFSGWTLNGNDFDFDTVITWAITLVAKRNIVEYTITYNLDWWTNNENNPSTYTIESWAITLQQPTKVWYTFLWWTGDNGNVAQTSITIPSWSYGNKEYNAVWTGNTNTQYTVYHYVKRVWQSTYELSDTETKYWTTDAILLLSSLAKENVFTCAHYDRWSLTWTESWPWEVVTQTTIRWDGTTKIYLYYVRDYYNVYLTGDEHVDILKINGVETEHAVLECGSEVPVDAVPKPWYHFVRWDREEREEREEEENEMSGG